MSQDVLERRYRWLLACYPPAYRAAYGEEMLAGSCALSAALIYELAWGAPQEPYKFGALSWKIFFAALITGSALLALKNKQRLLSWRAATATAVIAMLLAVLPAIQGGLSPSVAGSFAEMNSYMQHQTQLSEALPAGLVLVLLVVITAASRRAGQADDHARGCRRDLRVLPGGI